MDYSLLISADRSVCEYHIFSPSERSLFAAAQQAEHQSADRQENEFCQAGMCVRLVLRRPVTKATVSHAGAVGIDCY
jgi:hypothetical protein